MIVATVQCYGGCGRNIHFIETESGLEADGDISINLPGAVCFDCSFEIVKKIPNPPGIVCVKVLTEEMATSVLESGTFLRPPEDAALFFTRLFPYCGPVVAAAGNHLHISGLKDDAHAFFEYVLEQTDNPSLMKLNYAAILGMDDEPQRGLELLEQVPNTEPRYHVIKGNLLKEIGEWDLAAENWKQAINSDPTHAVAFQNLSYYFMQVKRDYGEAERHHRHCCTSFPDSRRFRAYLGDALFFQGRKEEALEEYQKALTITDSEPDADTFEQSMRKMIAECHKDLRLP
jgi:tetratricopeptide (TPR) repeat protein